MTVKELQERLKEFDEDAVLVMDDDGLTCTPQQIVQEGKFVMMLDWVYAS